MKTGIEDYFVIKNNKKLRFGYTTGSCATGAAKAATKMLLSGKEVKAIPIDTPKGIPLTLEVLEPKLNNDMAMCGIKKDGGDDPDATHEARVFAKVELTTREKALEQAKRYEDEFEAEDNNIPIVGIDGGSGVGRITKPGLEQPVGTAAINRVPRKMIRDAVLSEAKSFGYKEGLMVTISVESGEEIANKTFNPRLGIMGGISILGTSGIVEPMSEKALIASIELEMKQRFTNGHKYLLVTPGNYGTAYLNGNFPFESKDAVKCSNFVGQTIDMAINMGVEGILFVGHIGKFVKLAGGIMNTHSHDADSRMEILSSCAIRAGADSETALNILQGITTDDGLEVINGTPLWEPSLKIMMERIEFYLNFRAQNNLKLGAIVFSNVYGELGRTSLVDELIEKLKEKGE